MLQEVDYAAVTTFAQHLQAHLEKQLAPWREGLDETTEALIGWSWRHREALELEAGEGIPPPPAGGASVLGGPFPLSPRLDPS